MYTAHYIAYTYCCFLHSACLSTVTDHKPHAKVCTYPYQCSYLMLNVGNVHVTVRNYELWGQGSSFPACSNSRGVKLSEPTATALQPCCLSKAAGVRGSQHSIGMECSFLVQGQVSRGVQRSFETTDTLHLFYSRPLSTFIYCSLLYCFTNSSW